MKRLWRLNVLLMVVGLQSGIQIRAAEAILAYDSSGLLTAFAFGGAGFGFAPNADLAVTQLGYGGNDVSNEPVKVVLWDTNGVALRSVVVTTNSPLFNWSRYELVQPLILRSGLTYYVSGAAATNDMWVGEAIFSPAGLPLFTVSPDLTYYGMAVSTNLAGTFPEQFGLNDNLPVGANFRYVTGQLVVIDGMQALNGQVQLQLSIGGGTPISLTLLQAEQPAGPWTTNANTILTTNSLGVSYSLTATADAVSQFYKVQVP